MYEFKVQRFMDEVTNYMTASKEMRRAYTAWLNANPMTGQIANDYELAKRQYDNAKSGLAGYMEMYGESLTAWLWGKQDA
jgi:hypothetical protein